MRIKIVKYETRNTVNIGNIDQFLNDSVGDFKLQGTVRDLFRFYLTTNARVRVMIKINSKKFLLTLSEAKTVFRDVFSHRAVSGA